MSSKKINNKTIARIASIQTLYQYHLSNYTLKIDPLIEKMIKSYHDGELQDDFMLSPDDLIKIRPSTSYFTTLVKITVEHLNKLDEIILLHLTKEKDINALPVLLLSLLRVAICELEFFPEIPHKVVINEFTDITSDMLSENEVGFVNSMLDNISKGL